MRKKNDIALIELRARVYFSDLVKPACLHIDTNDVNSNVNLTVAGWGLISAECKYNIGLECFE